MTSTVFSERYLLARFPSGGVVIDLETGNYFRVDAIAAEVCDTLVRHDASVAAVELARRLDLPAVEAARAVAETRSALAAAPVRGTPTGPYHFHPEPGGYGLWHAGKRVLGVAGDDLSIGVPPGEGVERSPVLEFYLRALAPKIMFLRGLSVLHASACFVEDAVVAFAGLSGAGKTTTVRAFVGAGARPIAEDLLVLKPGLPHPSVVLGAEGRVHAWAKATSDALARGEGQAPSTELAAMAEGDHARVDALNFLDAGRRGGSEIVGRPVDGADALVALMANDFLGDSSRDGWRRYFDVAQWIVSRTRLVELTAPLGVDRLEDAARSYKSTCASYVADESARSPSQA